MEEEEKQKQEIQIHLEELRAVQNRIEIQIVQDRRAIAFSATLSGGLAALTATFLKFGNIEYLPIFLGIAPPLYFALATLNIRAICSGVEAICYILCVLRPRLTTLVGASVLNSESFYPLTNASNFPESVRTGNIEGSSWLRESSGIGRAILFGFPSIAVNLYFIYTVFLKYITLTLEFFLL